MIFLQATKPDCKKCYVFSDVNTLLFSHEYNAGVQIYHIRQFNTFLQTKDQPKKNCFEHTSRTMKKRRKGCGKSIKNCQNLHDHAKQRRVACLFSSDFCCRTILKQIVKSSLLEPIAITGVREDVKRFFWACLNRKCT